MWKILTKYASEYYNRGVNWIIKMDIEDILKSSPKEFAQKIRKLRSDRAKLKQLQLQKIREINKEANYNILKNKQEILKLKDKYFIGNYGEIKIFVN